MGIAGGFSACKPPGGMPGGDGGSGRRGKPSFCHWESPASPGAGVRGRRAGMRVGTAPVDWGRRLASGAFVMEAAGGNEGGRVKVVCPGESCDARVPLPCPGAAEGAGGARAGAASGLRPAARAGHGSHHPCPRWNKAWVGKAGRFGCGQHQCRRKILPLSSLFIFLWSGLVLCLCSLLVTELSDLCFLVKEQTRFSGASLGVKINA